VSIYAGQVQEAVAGAVDADKLAETWQALHPKLITKAAPPPPPPPGDAVAAAGATGAATGAAGAAGSVAATAAGAMATGAMAAILSRARTAITSALRTVLVKAWTEGWALGQQSAKAVTAPPAQPPPRAPHASAAGDTPRPEAVLRDVDWAGWKPGDPLAAEQIAGPGLRQLLDEQGIRIKSIADSRLEELAQVLEDALRSDEVHRPATGPLPPVLSVQDLASRLRGVLDNPDRAELVAQAEIARAQAVAARQVYAETGRTEVEVSTAMDDHVCAACDAAEKLGPHPIGVEPLVPLHPRCRCAELPVLDLGTRPEPEPVPEPAREPEPAKETAEPEHAEPDVPAGHWPLDKVGKLQSGNEPGMTVEQEYQRKEVQGSYSPNDFENAKAAGRKHPRDYQAGITQHIDEHGIINAAQTSYGVLDEGYHRYAAARQLGHKSMPVRDYTTDDLPPVAEAPHIDEGPLAGFGAREFDSDKAASDYLKTILPDLDADQKAVLSWYTGDGFHPLNKKLRDGQDGGPEAARLKSTMRELPDDLVVTRRVEADAFGLTDATLSQLPDVLGKVITDKGFMSTSLGKKPYGGSLGGVIMHLAVPKGTCGVAASAVSRNPHETELLLDSGQRIAVSRVERNKSFGWDLYGTILPAEGTAKGVVHAGGGLLLAKATSTVAERIADAQFEVLGPAPQWAVEAWNARPES
jgi:hypothetical protein